MPTTPAYVTRDGAYVATLESADDAMKWFHSHVSYSMDHALNHEGYAITDTMPKRRTYGIEISSTFVARVDDAEWPHFEWRVTLTREGKTRVLPYKMGLGHVTTKCGKRVETHRRHVHRPCDHARCQGELKPTPPDLYDVLTSLKADDTQGETFEDWCGNYGYDTDSRKAMDTYLACQTSTTESRKFFGLDWPKIVEDEQYT